MRSLVTSAALALVSLAACKHERGDPAPIASSSAAADDSSLAPPPLPPTPPKGMVYIPPGVLLAGTPEGKLPRLADVEMPGAQVVMKAFFIDELPYPNEAGAIPRSGVTQAEAEALCQAQGKRLCTELEWERACKGPANTVYPYGDTYRPGECNTGSETLGVPPSGVMAGCRSPFGMRDTHGVVWQWTQSPWGRGSAGNLVALRGGNALAGDVVGRCANAIPRDPKSAAPNVGLRCCLGDRNLAEVTINVVRGEALRMVQNDPVWMSQLTAAPPLELTKRLPAGEPFKVLHTWKWHPIGNEELVLQSGCAHPKGPHAICGVAIGRPRKEGLEPLGFASSAWWLANLQEDKDARELYVFGGDGKGGFRRKVAYTWGKVTIGNLERVAKKKAKKAGGGDEADMP